MSQSTTDNKTYFICNFGLVVYCLSLHHIKQNLLSAGSWKQQNHLRNSTIMFNIRSGSPDLLPRCWERPNAIKELFQLPVFTWKMIIKSGPWYRGSFEAHSEQSPKSSFATYFTSWFDFHRLYKGCSSFP